MSKPSVNQSYSYIRRSTHAVVAGVDCNTLAERIGHTDLTMLQKHYAAIAMAVGDTIGNVFDGMLKDDGTETD